MISISWNWKMGEQVREWKAEYKSGQGFVQLMAANESFVYI